MADERTDKPSWISPEGEQPGLGRYLESVRDHFWLVALTVLVTTAAAVVYVAASDRQYRAEADVLVTPVSRDDDRVVGLGLIQDSPDPTRDVETASRLVTTLDVARIVQQRLGTDRSPRALRDDVTAVPVAQSNIVAVTATTSSARESQRLANAFATALVVDRTRKLHERLDLTIANLRKRLGELPAPGAALRRRIGELETLRAGDDPTVRVAASADLPDHASWPRPRFSIAAGIVAGLVLGLGGALVLQLLDPRLRREQQLRTRYRLPVLARVPRQPRAVRGGVIPPDRLSDGAVEAFRTLRATLVGLRDPGSLDPATRAVLVTGSGSGEGKSTTALNLAHALAIASKRVILIEADVRNPGIGRALDIPAERGIASVLVDGSPLSEALVNSESHGGNLQVLLADRGGQWMADHLSLPAARAMIEQAKLISDYVVIDSPPVGPVSDALPLARLADDVLIVARLGKTDVQALATLAELLVQQRIEPAGFVVVGAGGEHGYGYYGGGAGDAPDRQPRREPEPERAPALPAS